MSYIDITIISIYLFFILCIGFYTRKYVNDFSGFMVAGRKVGLSLGVVTMLGTELGLITVMYNAQTGVNGFFASFHIGLAAFVVTMLIGVSGFVNQVCTPILFPFSFIFFAFSPSMRLSVVNIIFGTLMAILSCNSISNI